jgi:hypothetical protein
MCTSPNVSEYECGWKKGRTDNQQIPLTSAVLLMEEDAAQAR